VGACTALKRIRRAAEEVCPSDDGERDLAVLRQHHDCVRDSVERAAVSTRNALIQNLQANGHNGC